MIFLNLSNFKHSNFKDVYKYFMLQTQNEFKITVPKSYNPLEEESFEIFWEYHIMAYTGQKLYEISSEFSYNIPSARSPHPFIFIVSTCDLEKLADVLYDLVLLRQEDDLDVTTAFQFAASIFLLMPKIIKLKLLPGDCLRLRIIS